MTTTSDFRIKVRTTPLTDEQRKQFAAIDRRAKAFKPPGDLFDKDGNVADAKWAGILDDLEAWATRHNVKLTTSERGLDQMAPTGATPFTMSDCPSRTTGTEVLDIPAANQTITTKYTCYLKRRGLFNRCIYRCTSETV